MFLGRMDERGEPAPVAAEPGLDGGHEHERPGRPLEPLQLGDEPAVLGVEEPGKCPAVLAVDGHRDDPERPAIHAQRTRQYRRDDVDPGGGGGDVEAHRGGDGHPLVDLPWSRREPAVAGICLLFDGQEHLRVGRESQGRQARVGVEAASRIDLGPGGDVPGMDLEFLVSRCRRADRDQTAVAVEPDGKDLTGVLPRFSDRLARRRVPEPERVVGPAGRDQRPLAVERGVDHVADPELHGGGHGWGGVGVPDVHTAVVANRQRAAPFAVEGGVDGNRGFDASAERRPEARPSSTAKTRTSPPVSATSRRLPSGLNTIRIAALTGISIGVLSPTGFKSELLQNFTSPEGVQAATSAPSGLNSAEPTGSGKTRGGAPRSRPRPRCGRSQAL